MPVATITQPAAYKVGSTWRFTHRRKQPDGSPVNLAGLTVRAMFRIGSVDGDVLVTLADGAGLTIDAEAGKTTMEIGATTSATAPPNSWIFFDIEMTAVDGYVWQSKTYRFKTESQVTQ